MYRNTRVISKQNNTYWGRTQEYDTFLPVCGVLVPRGTAINHMLSPIVAKNAAAGISLHDSNQDLLFMDGMNEHGLVGGSFYYGNDYSGLCTHQCN
ncbi:linear amide C-N hydrolase [Erysipelothrix piscisicarius]|uniref:linear amide C-N hydrolase n=1 Tax=Erysipelothrix piscisicarius TaxID=2485784 RepID=UPI002F91DA14